MPLNEQFDVTHDNYRQITNLKMRYPGLRVLLSVGGGRDTEDKEKYLTLVSIVIACCIPLQINIKHTTKIIKKY